MTVVGVFEQNQTAVRRKAAFSGEVERVSEGDAADRSADEGGQRGADRRDCVGNSILLIFVRVSFPVTPVDTPRFPRRQQRSAEAYSTCLTKDEWDRRNRPGGGNGTGGTVPVGDKGWEGAGRTVPMAHPWLSFNDSEVLLK